MSVFMVNCGNGLLIVLLSFVETGNSSSTSAHSCDSFWRMFSSRPSFLLPKFAYISLHYSLVISLSVVVIGELQIRNKLSPSNCVMSVRGTSAAIAPQNLCVGRAADL